MVPRRPLVIVIFKSGSRAQGSALVISYDKEQSSQGRGAELRRTLGTDASDSVELDTWTRGSVHLTRQLSKPEGHQESVQQNKACPYHQEIIRNYFYLLGNLAILEFYVEDPKQRLKSHFPSGFSVFFPVLHIEPGFALARQMPQHCAASPETCVSEAGSHLLAKANHSVSPCYSSG